MNRTIASMLLCTVAGLGLAGCSHRGGNVEVRPVSSTEMLASTDVEEALRTGRDHLAAGRYGLAITQFRNATLLDPRSAAAQNGLAVAYASIGRTDLARRHFERAIAYAPDEASYRRNYARLSETRLRTMLAAAQRESVADHRDITAPKPAMDHSALVVLHTMGTTHPVLEPIANRASGPRLAATGDTGQGPVRVVTNAPAPVASFRSGQARVPVWSIVTKRAPLTVTVPVGNDRPTMERVSAQRLRLRTGTATAGLTDSCDDETDTRVATLRAGALSTRILSCRS